MFTQKDLSDGLVIAKKYTKSVQDAEDVLSKACIKAILKKDQCKGKFHAWFRAVVRTTALNHHRSDKPTVPLTADTDKWLGKEHVVYSESPCYQDIMEDLTNKEKDLILSRYVNKVPQWQIAQKYKVSPPTIRAWREMALDKLRRKYAC